MLLLFIIVTKKLRFGATQSYRYRRRGMHYDD